MAEANSKQSNRTSPSDWELHNDLLKTILTKYKNAKIGRRQTKASRQWFRKYLRQNFHKVRIARLTKGAKFANKPIYGKMYMFAYPDPKHKDTLPLYDAFPLTFFFNIGNNDHGLWYGINLHYLPPALRIKVFEILLKIKTSGRYNENTKVKLSWNVIQKLAQHDLFAHCVHAYIPSRIASKLIEVDPRVWEIIISLPTERFVGGTNKQAWSMKK